VIADTISPENFCIRGVLYDSEQLSAVDTKEDEMGRTYSTHGAEEKYILYKILVGTPEDKKDK
jgi:hypothetical protein